MELRNHYIATLIGLHIGDAIWAPYEIMDVTAVATALSGRSIYFHEYQNPWPKDDNGARLPAGRPTDDSDQTADLCHSLLACNGIDQDHLRSSLRESALFGKSRLWGGAATGAGRTTRRALGDDPVRQAEAFSNPMGTNGSLMRAAPMALWQGPTPEGIYPDRNGAEFKEVEAMSWPTHRNPDSVAASWLFVRMVRNALAERALTDVEAHSEFDTRMIRFMSETQAGGGLPADPGSFDAGWGLAEYTLKVALHAVLLTTSFAEAIDTVGRVGGDTDTYGAVAGALAGALYGTKAIPQEWQDTILGKEPMQAYAEAIYDARIKKQ